jgi:hypothetical protein
MRTWPRSERLALAVLVVVLVVSVLIAHNFGDVPGPRDAGFSLVLATAVVIVVGEWFQLSAPGVRGAAPLAAASAFALCFTVQMSNGVGFTFGAPVVIATTAAATTVGLAARLLAGMPVRLVEMAGRVVAVAVVAVLYRSVHLGQMPGLKAAPDDLAPWQRAVVMLFFAGIGLLADVLFTSASRALAREATLARAFVDGVWSSVALSVAVVVTGVLIALATRPLDLAALPLFLMPLVLTLFAFRRYVGIRATYLQSVRTLSRITDAAGYTPAGHSERVAALAVRVGRELAVPERELLDLEYAALLHDIGQVALVEPIPGGATVLAAPADQRRIETDTVAIVRETGVFEEAARILEHQTAPYRRVRELGEEIPLTSRILKVANAYEDLSRGARGQLARDSALERIYLGLGYEYDPRVVDALLHVLQVAHADDGLTTPS